MRKLTTIAVAVIALAIIGAPALGQSAARSNPSQSAQFGVRPVRAGETTLESGHFSYAVASGATISDGVVITNHQTRPISLRLYGADMITAAGGALAPAQADGPKRETGAWLELDKAKVQLPPGQQRVVGFTLRVPDGTPPGDFPGAVVVSTVAGKTKDGLAVETRVALLVTLRVVGEMLPAGEAGLVSKRDGKAMRFTVPVHNTGNVLYTVGGTIEVTRGRSVVARLPLGPKDIYVIPGGRTTLQATWPSPALGRVRAVAKLRGAIAKHEPMDLQSKSLAITLLPWLITSLIAGSLLVMVVRLRLTQVRRRRGRAERREARGIVRDLRAERARVTPTDALTEVDTLVR
jgi:hypothetical protein